MNLENEFERLPFLRHHEDNHFFGHYDVLEGHHLYSAG